MAALGLSCLMGIFHGGARTLQLWLLGSAVVVHVLSGPVVYGILIPQSESENCSVVFDSLQSHGLYSPWNSPGQDTEVGSLSLLQGIFPIQGSNPGLSHCRQSLPAEPPGKPLVPQPGVKLTSAALQGRSLTAGPPGKSPPWLSLSILSLPPWPGLRLIDL